MLAFDEELNQVHFVIENHDVGAGAGRQPAALMCSGVVGDDRRRSTVRPTVA
jgi:hypothetical protein